MDVLTGADRQRSLEHIPGLIFRVLVQRRLVDGLIAALPGAVHSASTSREPAGARVVPASRCAATSGVGMIGPPHVSVDDNGADVRGKFVTIKPLSCAIASCNASRVVSMSAMNLAIS